MFIVCELIIIFKLPICTLYSNDFDLKIPGMKKMLCIIMILYIFFIISTIINVFMCNKRIKTPTFFKVDIKINFMLTNFILDFNFQLNYRNCQN